MELRTHLLSDALQPGYSRDDGSRNTFRNLHRRSRSAVTPVQGRVGYPVWPAHCILFLARRRLFESILRRIRLSLFCRPSALPVHIPAWVRAAQIGSGSCALTLKGTTSVSGSSGAGALYAPGSECTPTREVEDSEGIIPVVILNWNGEHDTVECLKSIRNSVPAGVLPVIVDNGSDPESIERLKRACSQIYSKILYLTEKQLAAYQGGPRGGFSEYVGDDALVFIENGEN